MREYIFSHYNIFINLDKSFTIEYNFITPTYIMYDWRSGIPDKDIVEHKVIEDYSSSKNLQKTKIVFAKQLGYTEDGDAIHEHYSKSGITKNLDEIRQVILEILPKESLYIRTNLENECYKKTFFSELELYFNKENTLIGTNHIQNINIKYLSFFENNEKISIYMNQKTTTKHRPFSFSQDCTSIEYTDDYLIYGGYRAPVLIENNSIIYYSGSLIVEDFISRYSQRYYRESKKIEKKRIAKAWNITNVANYQFRSIEDPYKKNHPFAIYENVINQKEHLDLETAERMADEMIKTLKIRGFTNAQKDELENYCIQLVLIAEEKGSKKYKNYFQRLLVRSYLKIALVVGFVITMIAIRLF